MKKKEKEKQIFKQIIQQNEREGETLLNGA